MAEWKVVRVGETAVEVLDAIDPLTPEEIRENIEWLRERFPQFFEDPDEED